MIKRATALAATLALAAPAAANAGFKEPVKVLWQHTGSEGNYYGWGVAPLGRHRPRRRRRGDRRRGRRCPARRPGAAWVQSGRTGACLHKFDGQPGDQNGFAITDAGDIEPRRRPRHPQRRPAPERRHRGHAYLYSGRTRPLLHTFAGDATGDGFGTAVTSAATSTATAATTW